MESNAPTDLGGRIQFEFRLALPQLHRQLFAVIYRLLEMPLGLGDTNEDLEFVPQPFLKIRRRRNIVAHNLIQTRQGKMK